MAISVLKLIKLRNQLDKIKFENKYITFITGLKKIIQMSYRFEILQNYIDSVNESLGELKIEVNILIYNRNKVMQWKNNIFWKIL